MLTSEKYIQLSLQYNLFWIRIMKEHAFFIEATMPPPGKRYALRAGEFKKNYDQFMRSAILLSNGVIPADMLNSDQYYTQYTEEAERQAQKATGININTELTRMEYDIRPYNTGVTVPPEIEQDISKLNQNLLNLTNSFVRFQSELFKLRTTCNLFTMMFTADISHVLYEAIRYQKILIGLENRDDTALDDYKSFWSQNMAGHAKVMRGELDPTEVQYFNYANEFANTFDSFVKMETSGISPTEESLLSETQKIANFKADTTNGIIDCKVQAIMLALYTDHLLREANHFVWLLQV